MILTIRRITNVSAAQAEALAKLVPQLSPTAGIPSREMLQAVAESPSAALFAACVGERIVGMLTLAWCDLPSGRKAWVEDVVVDTAARGLGCGEKLVRAALTLAGELGVRRVLLTSNPARQAARSLYRKIGFEEAETTVFVFKID